MTGEIYRNKALCEQRNHKFSQVCTESEKEGMKDEVTSELGLEQGLLFLETGGVREDDQVMSKKIMLGDSGEIVGNPWNQGIGFGIGGRGQMGLIEAQAEKI